MSDTGFYRAFEDLHRGSRELIQSRLSVYLPFVRSVAQVHPGAPVTDVGCGRGEWLELLRGEGITAQGVDMDEGMLDACRALGLDVRHGDAVAFLRSLPGDSQAVVSGFHIAEHLPFDVLHALVDEAHRVLKPGGLLILETPNTENLLVGTSGFYMDPTHERPIPWQLLEFMAQYHGFGRTRLLRLQEPAQLAHRDQLSLLDVLGGASPDYAIVAQKAPRGEDVEALAEPFAQEHGLSLQTLAERYENKLRHDLHTAAVTAVQGERQSRSALDAAQATAAYQTQNDRMIHELQVRMARNESGIWDATQRAEAMHAQLLAVYASSSWRLTRPWRLAGRVARRVHGAVLPALSRLARALGIHGPLQRLYRKLRPVVAPGVPVPPMAAQEDVPVDDTSLSPAERRIAEQLDAGNRARGDKPH